MTTFAKKFNTQGARFDVNTENFEYHKIIDIYDKDAPDSVYLLKGLFINSKGKFKPSPVAIMDGGFLNLPEHMTDVSNEILKDDDAIKAINDHKVGFKIREYVSTNPANKGELCHTIEFVDL